MTCAIRLDGTGAVASRAVVSPNAAGRDAPRCEELILGPLGARIDRTFTVPKAPHGLPEPGATPLGEVELGMLAVPQGGLPVVVAPDGRLLLKRGEASSEPSAIVAWAMADVRDPFAKVSSTRQLKAVGDRLTQLLAQVTGTDSQESSLAQVESCIRSLILSAAERCHALRDDGTCKQLVRRVLVPSGRLSSKANAFYRDRVNSLMRAGRLVVPLDLMQREPTAPPYQAWARDGQIKVHLAVDDAGSTVARYVAHLRAAEFRLEGREGRAQRWVRRSTGELPIVVLLEACNSDVHMFTGIDRPDIDAVIYSGHAGYGTATEKALAALQRRSSGKDKAAILLQCSGDMFMKSVMDAFPGIQIVTTTEASKDHFDAPCLMTMLQGFARRQDWAAIQQNVVTRLASLSGDPRHYVFPSMSDELRSAVDVDEDGLGDSDDRTFDVLRTPNHPSAIISNNEPVQHDSAAPVPPQLATSPNIAWAIAQLQMTLRVHHALPPELEAKTAWSARRVIGAGVFEPRANETGLYRFTWDEATSTLHVATSSRLVAADMDLMRSTLAVELGSFLAAQAGLDEVDRTTLVMALLERQLHQSFYADWSGRVWAGVIVQGRYGLPLTAGEALALTGDPQILTPEHFERLRELVRQRGTMRQTPLVDQHLRLRQPLPHIYSLDVHELLRNLGLTGELRRTDEPGLFVLYHGSETFLVRITSSGERFDGAALTPFDRKLGERTSLEYATMQATDLRFGNQARSPQALRDLYRALARGDNLDRMALSLGTRIPSTSWGALHRIIGGDAKSLEQRGRPVEAASTFFGMIYSWTFLAQIRTEVAAQLDAGKSLPEALRSSARLMPRDVTSCSVQARRTLAASFFAQMRRMGQPVDPALRDGVLAALHLSLDQYQRPLGYRFGGWPPDPATP